MSQGSQQEYAQEEEDGNHGPLSIEKLLEYGISAQDIEKMQKNGGLYTVESVAYTPKKTLMQIKGISDQKADKILNEGKTID